MLGSPDNGFPAMTTTQARKRRFAMPWFILAVVGLVVLLLTAAGRSPAIRGSGSTLAQPLIERSAVAYRDAKSADRPDQPSETGGDWSLNGTGIEYEPVGSLGGIMRLKSSDADFAISDYPLSAQALDETRAEQFPIALGSIAIVHTVTLPAGTALRLDAPTQSGLYLGRITRWDDPAIARLNPGVKLPATQVTAVHRSDGSGSTFGFTSYLTANSPQWRGGPGTGTVVQWPTGVSAMRTSGALAAVQGTPGSIGYVESGQAARADLSVALLKNASGRFQSPGQESMRAAVTGVDWSGKDRYAGPLPQAGDPSAYPLTVAIYALLPHESRSRGATPEALRYLRFVMESYDTSSQGLGYLPLPQSAVSAVTKRWPATFGSAG